MEKEVEVWKHAYDQAKYAGYGDDSTGDMLKAAVALSEKQFKIYPSPLRNEEGLGSSELTYNYSDKTGKYYLNTIHMTVKAENPAKPVRSYTFRVDKDNKWTQKQAFNMLMGRAVCKMVTPKEKEPYEPWLQFDFTNLEENGAYRMRQWHPKYGFDLREVLKKYNIEGMDNERKLDYLVSDLKRGNLQPVVFITSKGELVKGFTEAAPGYKSVNNYDEQKELFKEGHELSGFYKGEKDKTEVLEAGQPKEEVAQQSKSGPDLPAQNKDKQKVEAKTAEKKGRARGKGIHK